VGTHLGGQACVRRPERCRWARENSTEAPTGATSSSTAPWLEPSESPMDMGAMMGALAADVDANGGGAQLPGLPHLTGASWLAPWPPWTDRELVATYTRTNAFPSGGCDADDWDPTDGHCLQWRASDEALLRAVALARRNASVFALSARDLFCSTSDAASAECGPTLQPLPVVGYLDGDHLNKAGALFLWPYLCDAFERFGFFGPADEAAPAGERVIVY